MTRLEGRVPAGETASSKSPWWEHKLEVVKPHQEAQEVTGRERGHRLEKQAGPRSSKVMSLNTPSVVQGPAVSASPESLLKITPNLYFSSFTAIRLSGFRQHNLCLQ